MRLSHEDQLRQAALFRLIDIKPETPARREGVSDPLPDATPVQLTRELINRARATNISTLRLTQSRGAVERFNAIDRAVRNLPSPRRRE